jgi:hypothetical protein
MGDWTHLVGPVSNPSMTRTRVVGFGAGVVGMMAAVGAVGLRRVDPRVSEDFGIPACPASAVRELLSVAALQCWLEAPNGRWRILGHESLHGELIVHVNAAQVRDAEAIARRFVDSEGQRSSEILLYVNAEPPSSAAVTRRVRWTPGRGVEVLEFAAEPLPTRPD